MSLMTPTKTKRAARRCLFGRPDQKKITEWLDEQLENIRQKDMEKWGFDFAIEHPIPGSASDYEYIPVIASSVPGFYKSKFVSASHSRVPLKKQEPVTRECTPECEENRPPLIPSDSESDTSMDCSSISSASPFQATPKRRKQIKQAKVTDYMKARKRLTHSPKTSDLSSAASPRASLRV